MIETGKIINGDCIEEMAKLPEGCIDLIVIFVSVFLSYILSTLLNSNNNCLGFIEPYNIKSSHV